MASDHEHPYAQYIQSLLASYYSSLMEDRSHPGHAQAAFAMAVNEMQFPLMVVVAPPAGDYEAYFEYLRECDKHAERVDQIHREVADPYARKKQLKLIKPPQYNPSKKLNLEVLGVMRLNTDLILETLYDRKSPDRKTYDVSELVIQFLEKVQHEHKDRLESFNLMRLNFEKDIVTTMDQEEEPSCGDVALTEEFDGDIVESTNCSEDSS